MFLFSATTQLWAGRGATQFALASVGFTDAPFIRAASHLIPFAEGVLGLWVLSGLAAVASAFVATLVLTAFSVALLIMGFAHGWQGPCPCLGSATGTIIAALVRNALLLALSAWLVWATADSGSRTGKTPDAD